MSADCKQFRRLLERSLRGRPDPAGTVELSWHEHLLGCGACRDLLEAEEALEVLLASLPEPRLPSALAERVLAALAAHRGGDDLDRLLDLAAEPVAPPELSRDVLDGLATARAEARLDDLLDRVPAPGVPRGLARDVLAALEPHRRRPALRLLRGRLPHVAAAATVVAVLAYGAWRLTGSDPAQREDPPEIVAPGPERTPTRTPAPIEPREVAPRVADVPVDTPVDVQEPPALPDGELLAALDVLENWELLTDNGLDALLAGSDPVDVLLLDYAGEDLEALDADDEEEG
jgi:hypothetical protein